MSKRQAGIIQPRNCDASVRHAIMQLASKVFGPESTPTFAGLELTGLTAERLIWADASSAIASKDLIDLVAGTASEITVADDGSGGVTIGLVDPLAVGKGGTGAATLTDHGLLVGSGTDAVTVLAAATNGQIPIGSTGADPVLATITGTANQITVTNDAGSIALATPQDIHTEASPTFAGLTATGTVNASGGEVLTEDNATSAPTDKSDGYVGVAEIGGDGRIYFTVEGTMYYIKGTAAVVPITGNPIGLLLALTYNLE